MKNLILSLVSLALACSAYAQLNTFSDGDTISAEKMNQNFQHLEQQFRGTRATTVNCAAGGKIGDAISNGYTNITVSGTCTENLLFFEEWGDNTFALAPRYLKLTGADSTAKIVDASGGAKNTVFVGAGTTLSMENMTISGGTYGAAAYRNSNLLLSNVTIEGFIQRGISVSDSSYLGVDDGGVTISGGAGAERGIHLGTGSSGWVHTSNISNVERGINLYSNSFLYLYNFTIEASITGINIGESKVMKINDGVGVIEGTSDRAVSAGRSHFYSWGPGSLTIQNLNGGRGISLETGISQIVNLKILDFDSTGSDWNPALNISAGSSVSISSAEITGSADGDLVSIDDGSILQIENSTLTVSSASNAIDAYGSSWLKLRNSTISGSVTNNLVNISLGSSADFRDSILTITSGEQGLYLGSSDLNFRNSTISGFVTDNLVSIFRGSSAEIRDSTLTATSAERGLSISGSSLNFRNSTITGTVTDNLINITEGSNAYIRESNFTATTSETWNSGIYLSDASELELRESILEATHRGMAVQRNSYAELSNGSSITAGANSAVTVYGGAGMKIRSGSSVVSTGASAIDISQSSWVEIDGGDGSTINRTDDGDDINVSTMGLLSVYSGNSIGAVSCSSKGYVSASDGTVTTLPDSCTQ